jgi:hypothetical protein
MRRSRQFIASAVVSVSLIASSTAAVAQSAPAPVPQFDPWAVLSVMSGGAPAASICGAAAAAATAAQPGGGCVLPQTGVTAPVETVQNVPPPPPPPNGFGFPLPVLLIWAGVLAALIYIATQNNHTHVTPNSPA